MLHKLVFLPGRTTVFVESGITVLQACRNNGIPLDAPCGGNGTCGKCLVGIIGDDGEVCVKHACKTRVFGDMTVDLSSGPEHRILLDGVKSDIDIDPPVKCVSVSVPKPSVEDIRSEWRRLTDAVSEKLGTAAGEIDPNPRIPSLYTTLKENSYRVDALVCANEIIDVVPSGERFFAMAFDIGTTTIVGYLLDLSTGEQTAVSSSLNPQSIYGADVVTRSKYAMENGTKELSGAVRGALNDIIRRAASEAGADPSRIYLVTIAGNTCMHHLFLGISPQSLVFAPYTMAIGDTLRLNARDYDLCVNDCARLLVLPNIAGFVGADTTGAILASGIDRADSLTLLIDIGTNGEIVLGDRHRMVACSTAAGPAFEGALIECGMRGAEGAIDHFSIGGAGYEYSVVGGGKPVGICGSGLIDVVAELLGAGIIDPSGRLADPGNNRQKSPSATPSGLSERIRKIGGIPCFVIAEANESANGKPVYITQKDIREVQLAKAAIAAGIKLLAAKLGVGIDDIERVLIAGAFGNYMSPRSACRISLIPPQLESRILPVGNAAGEGAKRAALDRREFGRAKLIAERCDYLELAAHPDFQDMFIDELDF